MKALLGAIEKRYDDRFKKIDNIQKICEKKCPGSEKPVWKYRQSRKQQQRYVR